MILERIKAKGHENITARHRTTLEFTKEKELTLAGNCIVAVKADKGMPEFSREFRDALRGGASLRIRMQCNGVGDSVEARGHSSLTLQNPEEMVIRRSNFICDRTLAIKADKAAIDLDRKLIEEMKLGKDILITLEVIE